MSKLKKKSTALNKVKTTLTKKRTAPKPTAPVSPPPPGDMIPAEVSVEAELTELQAGFRARHKQEQGRFLNTTDSEYWFCLCFQTRDQKEEFLEKMGLLDLGDKYLDGLKVAERLEVEIESPTPKMPKLRTDRKLKALAMPLLD